MVEILPSSYGFILPRYNIALDSTPADAAWHFVTHAHSDHVPNRKKAVIATPATAAFMKIRGFVGPVKELDFGVPMVLPQAQVTLFPAGHILGSAMVYIETAEGCVLYTGDCRRPAAPPSEGFVSPENVDVLITEATFGLPVYRWRSHDDLFSEIRTFAENALNDGFTPVFYAYSLGKSQEIANALAPSGIRCQLHGSAFQLCPVYQKHGINLGNFEKYQRDTLPGAALITPSSAEGQSMITKLKNIREAYVSGWASNESMRQQTTADALIPLSDHIDFYELLDWVKMLRPKITYIVHSPTPDVVCHFLQKEGLAAKPFGNHS